MKKLSLLLLFPFFMLFSCSDDNEETQPKAQIPQEVAQDYTSFLFALSENKDFKYTNCIAAYFDEKGYCLKLADIGEVSINQISKETKVNIDTLTRVYLFVDIENEKGDAVSLLRFEQPFILKKNYKNVYNLAKQTKLINVTESLKEYPH